MNQTELKSAIVDIFKTADDNEKLIKDILRFVINQRRSANRHYIRIAKQGYSLTALNAANREFQTSKFICDFIISLYRSKGH